MVGLICFKVSLTEKRKVFSMFLGLALIMGDPTNVNGFYPALHSYENSSALESPQKTLKHMFYDFWWIGELHGETISRFLQFFRENQGCYTLALIF